MPITLPTAPTPAEVVDPSILLIYGHKKQGKTDVMAALSRQTGACVCDLEWSDAEGRGGTKFVTATKVRLDSVAAFKDFCAQCAAACKAGKPPYPLTIWDPIDRIEEWAIEESTARYAATPQGQGMKRSGKWDGGSIMTVPGKDESTGGAGWGYLREDMMLFLRMTLATAPQVVWVGHVRDVKAAAEKSERLADSKDLDLMGQGRRMAAGAADATGYVVRDSQDNLMISFATKDNRFCGCRCAHLSGRDFALSEWVADGKGGKCLQYHWERVYLGLAGMKANNGTPPTTTTP